MLCTYIDHRHSADAEWCSVLDGLLFAKKLDRGAIHLENDNQGLINALIYRRPPRHMDSYDAIADDIPHLEYIGIRGIPRGLNRADGLFDRS